MLYRLVGGFTGRTSQSSDKSTLALHRLVGSCARRRFAAHKVRDRFHILQRTQRNLRRRLGVSRSCDSRRRLLHVAKTIRIDAGGRTRHWTEPQLDVIAATYREWAQRAADHGYAIGPETHWGPENHVDGMLQLAQAVNSPGYGILLHMGKDVDGAPDDYDRALAPLAVHTHIDQTTSYTRIESALRILRDAGYRGCLGVEHHSARNEYAEVAAQLALVRRGVTLLAAEPQPAAPAGNPLLGGDDVRHQR